MSENIHYHERFYCDCVHNELIQVLYSSISYSLKALVGSLSVTIPLLEEW